METIRKGPPRSVKIAFFVAFTFAFLVPNYSQYQISPLASRLMEELAISPGKFTSVFSAPMVPAMFLSIICGLLVDRYGFKIVLGISILLTALGVVGRVFAQGFTQFYICMMLLGMSSGFLVSNASKIIGTVFEPQKVGVVVGYAISIGTAMMIVAMSTTAMLETRTAFIIAGVIAVIDVIVWFTAIPKKHAVSRSKTNVESSGLSFGQLLSTVLKNKYVWFVAVGLFCVNAAMVGMNSLISAALMTRGMSETAAGAASAFTLVGNLLGSLIIPTISAKTGRLRAILVVSSVVGAIGTAFAWLAPAGVLLYIALLLTGLGIGSVLPQLVAVNIRLPGIGPKYSGTAGGVITTIQLLGGITIPTFVAAPIAGGNYYIYFIICGAIMLVCMAAMFCLPKSLDVKS